jgi:hypothetical protein
MCTECGTQCDACQRKAHSTPAGSSHTFVSFSEQRKKKQLALESSAAAEKRMSGYEPFMAEVAEYEATLADHATFAAYAKGCSGESDRHRWLVARVVSCLCTSLMHVLRLSRLVSSRVCRVQTKWNDCKSRAMRWRGCFGWPPNGRVNMKRG